MRRSKNDEILCHNKAKIATQNTWCSNENGKGSEVEIERQI